MTDTPTTPQATAYLILEQVEADGPLPTWVERGQEIARDNTQAIKQHLAAETDVNGVFVATPARSWKPVPVKSRVALDFGGEA